MDLHPVTLWFKELMGSCMELPRGEGPTKRELCLRLACRVNLLRFTPFVVKQIAPTASFRLLASFKRQMAIYMAQPLRGEPMMAVRSRNYYRSSHHALQLLLSSELLRWKHAGGYPCPDDESPSFWYHLCGRELRQRWHHLQDHPSRAVDHAVSLLQRSKLR